MVKERNNVAIIGLGYVGLPLALAFAKAGLKVVGLDVDRKKVSLINMGKSYIDDVKGIELKKVVACGKLSATTNFSLLSMADAIFICVPTPLNQYKEPDLAYVNAAVDQIAKYLKKGQLIVLESTTYPGTTEDVVLPKLDRGGRLTVGKDFFLAFSPERVDPGNKTFSFESIPKVVGGMTDCCGKLAQSFYQKIYKEIVMVSSPKVAEMEKLLENIFRNVNIALVNELAILCGKMGIDIWEVIAAAKTKPYGFMPFYPGPGLGGHCIPVDPFYLSWKAKAYDMRTRFIELAGEINDKMPEYVVEIVQKALNNKRKSLKGSRIIILGVAYKKDIADTRESPAYKIISLLRQAGALVKFNDPFVKEINISGQKMKSWKIDKKCLQAADCLLIVTNHSEYDYPRILKIVDLVVDTRGAIKHPIPLNCEVFKI